MVWLVLGLLLSALWAGGTWGVQRLALTIGSISNPSISARGVQVRFEHGGGALLAADALRLGGRSWSGLALRCARARLEASVFHCSDGRVAVAGKGLPLTMALEVDLDTGAARAAAGFDGGGRIEVVLAGGGDVRLDATRLAVRDLRRVASLLWEGGLVQFDALDPDGLLDGQLIWSPEAASAKLSATLSEGAFGSADGLLAGEALGLVLNAEANWRDGGWQWQADARWDAGAAYVHPLYLEAGPALQASGVFAAGRLEVRRATARLDGVREVSASGSFDLNAGRAERLLVRFDGVDLAVAGPRWIAPLVLPAQVDRLVFSGSVSAAVEVRGGGLHALDVAFDAAGFGLRGAAGGAGLALGPLAGEAAWSRSRPTRMRVRAEGGRWEKLTLGAFELDARIEAERVAFARTVVPLLDGAVVIEDLVLAREAGHWEGRGGVVVEPVSMRALTEALDLPVMTGVLSAALPGVRASPGAIELEGALVISVFDGYLQATGLRVLEPFGVASHLSADIEARHIDLAQLTETFSFGSMSGFVDADLRGLELARWQPVAFDARIASSAGQYPRRISQRAVQNISALGGAGAVAALQRGLLGLFESFGYREVGLRCALRDGVCMMDGIEGARRADGGFPIVRGGGVPALDVIGYNRRVDWDELVDRLQRVIAENVSPELR